MPCRDLPSNIKATKYPGYYITEDGDAYREPLSKGERMPINEYGLVYLKPALRGHVKYPEKQYHSVNITLRDENGKWLKQIKECNHRLVAETFIPNPEGYTEVLHGDKGNRCNHYTNLRWGTHKENMQEAGLPEGSIRYHNRNTTHPDGCERNPTKYIKKDGKWVLIPSDKPPWNKGLKGSSWNTLPDGSIRTRKVNGKPGTFIKENGKWVYQTDNPKPRGKKKVKENKPKKEPLCDGTISIRADGTTWIKENGKWVYQKKKKS